MGSDILIYAWPCLDVDMGILYYRPIEGDSTPLVIDSEFLSCFVDTDFILALPLHHRDLELDSVGVLTKSY